MVFTDEWMALFPKYLTTKRHSHPMIHIIISEFETAIDFEKLKYSKIFFIAPHTSHEVVRMCEGTLVFLIDPCSVWGRKILSYMGEKNYFCDEISELILRYLREKEIFRLKEILFEKMTDSEIKSYDKRIEAAIAKAKSQIDDISPEELARFVNLSTSRFSHLFKEETGINAMEFLMMHRTLIAVKKIHEGKSITESALEGNFYDAAHFAKWFKKLTGINASKLK